MKKILTNKLYMANLGLDLLSNFGDNVYYLALMTYVTLLPNAKLAIAIITLSETLPILSGFVMGYLADKQVRKIPLIISTQFFRFALYLIVGVVMGFSPGLWIVLVVAVLNFFSDMAGQLEGGLYQPLSLRLIKPEERAQAMAFSSSLFQTAYILFKFSGAALITVMTYQNLAFLNATTFLICALGMLGLKKQLDKLVEKEPFQVQQTQSEQGFVRGLWESMLLAIKEMTKIPEVRFSMIIVPILNALFATLETFILLVITEDKSFGFGTPALTLSVFGIVQVIGGLLGNVLVMSGKFDVPLTKILRYSAVATVPTFLTLYTHQIYLFFAIVCLVNLGFGMINPKMGALIKNSLPEHLLGTLFSGMATYFQCGVILMKLVLSGLVLLFPTPVLLLIMLVLTVIYACYSLFFTVKEV